MKTKSIYLLLAIILYLGCAKDDSFQPGPAAFQSALFVTIKDPAGAPVKDAEITIGNVSGTTASDGTLLLTHITLTGNDYLQAEKSGYFNGSRRFYADEAALQFLQITLLPRTIIGSFNSGQGATLYIDNHSRLTFPADAISRQDGTPYEGKVHVMASPIYGDDPHLSDKMPGDLVGQNESGNEVALGSFGMLAVELMDDFGAELQITSGKSVELQLAIADHQLAKAPQTIPLWYFDEENGYWVEEGEAHLNGHTYVGQLPHFSYWNCDIPLELVNWEAEFRYHDGQPAQQAAICLTIKSLNAQRCALANSSGIVFGEIPANEAMVLTIPNDCGEIIYTEEVGPFNDDIRLEARMINPLEKDYATISGRVLQCDGLPLSSGYVKVTTPHKNYVFTIADAAGHFEGGYTYCNGDLVTLQVYDIINSLTSAPQVINFERNLSLGNIQACDELDEYLRYTVTGFSPEFLYYLPEVDKNNFHITKIHTLDSIGVKGRFAFTFDGTTTGQYKGYPLFGNQVNLPNGQTAYITDMQVIVTEYGGTNEYIRGEISGKLNAGGNGAGGPGASNFSGSFAVRNK